MLYLWLKAFHLVAVVTWFAALFYLPLNPVAFVLAFLSRQELPPLALFGAAWSGTTVHLTFHCAIGIAGYLAHRWALRRELTA